MLYPYTITGIWKIMEDHLKNREIRNKTVLIQTGWDLDDKANRTRPVHT